MPSSSSTRTGVAAPVRRHPSWLAALIVTVELSAVVVATAQGDGHGMPQRPAAPAEAVPQMSQEEKWRRRWPQPVLVSDLIGRLVINRDQGVLGRIETLVRTPDDQVQIVFARRTFFSIGGTSVAVPAQTTALLGHFVMVVDVTDEEIARLPPFASASAQPVERGSRIRMALTKH